MKTAYRLFRTYCFPSLEYYLRKLTKDSSSIVDLGCGPDSPVKQVTKDKESLGVDAAEASIEESKRKKIFTKYLVANILNSGIPPKSYDTAISLDVLNLLEKQDGYTLLKEMERIARKRIILLLPNGRVEEPQEMKENAEQFYKSTYEYLKYRSGWTAHEMRKLGFKVIGINGLKALRKNNAKPAIRPTFLGAIISELTQPIARVIPSKAFHLLCYKDL